MPQGEPTTLFGVGRSQVEATGMDRRPGVEVQCLCQYRQAALGAQGSHSSHQEGLGENEITDGRCSHAEESLCCRIGLGSRVLPAEPFEHDLAAFDGRCRCEDRQHARVVMGDRDRLSHGDQAPAELWSDVRPPCSKLTRPQEVQCEVRLPEFDDALGRLDQSPDAFEMAGIRGIADFADPEDARLIACDPFAASTSSRILPA